MLIKARDLQLGDILDYRGMVGTVVELNRNPRRICVRTEGKRFSHIFHRTFKVKVLNNRWFPSQGFGGI